MSMAKLAQLFLLLGVGLASCQGSEFEGDSAKKTPRSARTTKPRNSDQGPGDGRFNGANGADGLDGRNRPDGAEVDADASGTVKEEAVLTIEEKTVEFGVGEVFHLGDNEFDDSTCKAAIRNYALSGRTFLFSFKVETDNTEVEISIDTICGINNKYQNFTSLTKGGVTIQRQPLPFVRGGASQFSFGKLTLGPGVHQVEVHSGLGLENRDDFDDFIVGNIRIFANKRIYKGEVTARP